MGRAAQRAAARRRRAEVFAILTMDEDKRRVEVIHGLDVLIEVEKLKLILRLRVFEVVLTEKLKTGFCTRKLSMISVLMLRIEGSGHGSNT